MKQDFMPGSDTTSRPQFRLTTLILLTSFIATLAAWYQDHRTLAGRVAQLEQERRQRIVETLEVAAKRIKGFADRHGGLVARDSGYWMWVDLQGKTLGNKELAEIAEDMVVVHEQGPPTPRFLALYGSEVTEAYAAELSAAAPSWRVIINQRMQKSDVVPNSSNYRTRF